VDRPVCEEAKSWDDNNYGEQPVTLPVLGEGMITSPCTRGQIGPLRNCGFGYDGNVGDCAPGEPVTITCSLKEGAEAQAVRVCEASKVLGAGTACLEQQALASLTVLAGASASATFTCPAKRDVTEPGGLYSAYVGALWPEDETTEVTCTLEP
jgi:hypothetical protein